MLWLLLSLFLFLQLWLLMLLLLLFVVIIIIIIAVDVIIGLGWCSDHISRSRSRLFELVFTILLSAFYQSVGLLVQNFSFPIKKLLVVIQFYS